MVESQVAGKTTHTRVRPIVHNYADEMWRGISSKVVHSGNRQRAGVIEDWDFVDAALVRFQNGESVRLTPAKAIFQQIILFRDGWIERGSEEGGGVWEGTNPSCPIYS